MQVNNYGSVGTQFNGPGVSVNNNPTEDDDTDTNETTK